MNQTNPFHDTTEASSIVMELMMEVDNDLFSKGDVDNNAVFQIAVEFGEGFLTGNIAAALSALSTYELTGSRREELLLKIAKSAILAATLGRMLDAAELADEPEVDGGQGGETFVFTPGQLTENIVTPAQQQVDDFIGQLFVAASSIKLH